LFVCFFVCLLAGLHSNYYSADFYKLQWKGDAWALENRLDFVW